MGQQNTRRHPTVPKSKIFSLSGKHRHDHLHGHAHKGTGGPGEGPKFPMLSASILMSAPAKKFRPMRAYLLRIFVFCYMFFFDIRYTAIFY